MYATQGGVQLVMWFPIRSHGFVARRKPTVLRERCSVTKVVGLTYWWFLVDASAQALLVSEPMGSWENAFGICRV